MRSGVSGCVSLPLRRHSFVIGRLFLCSPGDGCWHRCPPGDVSSMDCVGESSSSDVESSCDGQWLQSWSLRRLVSHRRAVKSTQHTAKPTRIVPAISG